MRFKAGDLVAVVEDSISPNLRYEGLRVGSIGTVIGYAAPGVTLVEFPGVSGKVCADEPAIRKVSDGDDRKTCSWGDCAWQPHQVAA